MAVTYSPAALAVTDKLADVIRRSRPDLHAAGVRVAVVMAATDEPGEPALKARGVAVTADVRVVPLLWRSVLGGRALAHVLGTPRLTDALGEVAFGELVEACGTADALLRIDAAAWADMPDAEHASLLHHEVMHLVLAKCWAKRGGGLGWKTDDLGRPKLKTRPGDMSPTDGFAAVIAEHGEDSHEFRAYVAAREFAGRSRAGELPPHAAAAVAFEPADPTPTE